MSSTLSPSTSSQVEISPVDALWALIQNQSKSVRKALIKRLIEEEKASVTKKQQAMVKESLTNAFEDLRLGQVKHDARQLFSK